MRPSSAIEEFMELWFWIKIFGFYVSTVFFMQKYFKDKDVSKINLKCWNYEKLQNCLLCKLLNAPKKKLWEGGLKL